MDEKYVQHPNFGLLYSLCTLDANSALFTTLYAQRLFFLVSIQEGKMLSFEPKTRAETKNLLENRLRVIKRSPSTEVLREEMEQLEKYYKQLFI
ncbi:MAG: PII-interacting protein PipX family protein [Gloeobacterales cyanobacterium]